MKKVDKFILKAFLGPLVLTFFIVLFILIMQFLWMYIDELVGKGLEAAVVAELIFDFSLTFVPTAMPLAILLASLMTFGNLGEFSELTALKASGVPLYRIMQPLMILTAFLVVFAFFYSNYVVPFANGEARSLLYDIRQKRPDVSIQAGSFNSQVDGFSIKIAEKDPETNRMDRIMIYDHREQRGNVSIIYADSGYIKLSPDNSSLVMTLYNGYAYSEIEESKSVALSKRHYPSRRDEFDEQSMVISISGLDFERSDEDLFGAASWLLNMEELTYFIDSMSIVTDNRLDNFFNDYLDNIVYTFNADEQPYISSTYDSLIVSKDSLFLVNEIYRNLDDNSRVIALERAIDNLKDSFLFLRSSDETIKTHVVALNGYIVNWHKKLTMPFACLIFFFIGAPLGAIIRKGGLGTPSVISVFFFVVWYVLSMLGENYGESGRLPCFVGMWISSLILLPIGIFLTYKATTDSTMMNAETYGAFFKKLAAIFKKKELQNDNKLTDLQSNSSTI